MVILNCMILVSTTCFIVETMPQFRHVKEETWFLLETICIAGFSIDFVVRLLCTPDCKAFWTEFMNMVDFVAIMPYYVEMGVKLFMDDAPIPQYLRVIRVVRLARVLRIIRMTKAGKMAGVIVDIANTSISALLVPAYFMYTLVVIYGTGVYYSEKGIPVSCLAMPGTDTGDLWISESLHMHPKAKFTVEDYDQDGWMDADVGYGPDPNNASNTLGYHNNIVEAEERLQLIRQLIDDSEDEDIDKENDMTHQFCGDRYQARTDEWRTKVTIYFDRIFGRLAPFTDPGAEPLLPDPKEPGWESHKGLGGNWTTKMKGREKMLNMPVKIGGLWAPQTATYTCDPEIETCCYCLRNGVYTDSVGYNSVPDGLWFILVTMTTVGYGDIFPVTWAGRGVAMCTMCCAVFCIAMPLTIVGTSFNHEWEELERKRHEEEEEEMKDVQSKSHTKLKENVRKFEEKLKAFSTQKYIGKSDTEKLTAIEADNDAGEEGILQSVSDLTAELTGAFELYQVGLLYM
jgi:hypothetical protein